MRYLDSASPVLVLPSQQPSFGMDSNRPIFSTPFSNGATQSPNSTWSNLTPTQATPASAAGRKRSRDEAAPNLEDDYFAVQVLPEPENEAEWEYGEGMVLIKPNSKGRIIEAGSQTGTWAEEQAEEKVAMAAAVEKASLERPILRAAKSQRLDLSSTPPITEEVMSNGTLVNPPSPERKEPTVDDFTRHLGIGWSSMDNADADMQIAVRGWNKFIENHFPIVNPRIRLQSRGLASYLVDAREGYFLFGEDLKQGRLVSTNLETVWINLRGAVPIFEGEIIMEAGSTPKVATAITPTVVTDDTMNGMEDAGVADSGQVMNGVEGLRTVEYEAVMTRYATYHEASGLHDAGFLNGTGKYPTPEHALSDEQTMEVEMDMS